MIFNFFQKIFLSNAFESVLLFSLPILRLAISLPCAILRLPIALPGSPAQYGAAQQPK